MNIKSTTPAFIGNDAGALVYNWFANIDRFSDVKVLMGFLNPGSFNLSMNTKPIKNYEEFKNWYNSYRSNVLWQNHEIRKLRITGDETNGFQIGFDAIWEVEKKDNSFKGTKEMHHDWLVVAVKEGLYIKKIIFSPIEN